LLDGSIVKEAAVGIEEDRQVGPRLTAYLVPKPGKIPTKNELIDRLKTRLPEYMIPTDFVILDRLCLHRQRQAGQESPFCSTKNKTGNPGQFHSTQQRHRGRPGKDLG